MEYLDVLLGGLAGLGLGLSGMVWFILRQKGETHRQKEELNLKISDLESSTHSLATENRLQKEEIQRAEKLEAGLREQLSGAEGEKIEKATQPLQK